MMYRVLLALVLLARGASPADSHGKGDPGADETYTVECTFHNPAYSGPCTVTEEVSEKLSTQAACSQVLACLNDSRCLKTYCNATTVRGGWTLAGSARRPPGSPSGPVPPRAATPTPAPDRR